MVVVVVVMRITAATGGTARNGCRLPSHKVLANQLLTVQRVQRSQVGNLFGELTENQLATGDVIGVIAGNGLLQYLLQTLVYLCDEINVPKTGTI